MQDQTPQSRPIPPAQPDRDTFSPAELALFRTYTREGYRAAFGVEPPPYDPTRVIKNWFDTTVDTTQPENVALYRVFDADASGQWGFRQMVMPAREAATVNLPGVVTYPPYVIQPTTAKRGGGLLRKEGLSLETEARAILQELGITAELVDIGRLWDGTAFPTQYGDEPRREWAIVYKGGDYYVGNLLREKSEFGIGAPGRWQVGDRIAWIPDPPAPSGFEDKRPPRLMPVRDLLPNERLIVTLMGAVIGRNDRRPTPPPAVAPVSTEGFTVEDRALLREIRDTLARLASK